MLKGLYLLDADAFEKIYGERERQEISRLVDIYAPLQTRQTVAEDPHILRSADLVFSGWGCPPFTQALLEAATQLKVVFYGAGSIKYFITDAFWKRQILVSSAYAANGIPVMEFTVSQILLSLKGYWQHVHRLKQGVPWWDHLPSAGAYNSTVGLISLGMIGRMVAEQLKSYQVKVIAYDPFTTPEIADRLNVSLLSLDEVFARADVVSLHTPWLPETEGLITGAHLASMKAGATFINTARGAIVRETEMIAVFQNRPDLTALLDVTYPEPPARDSPLYRLPNAILTPHIAGPNDNECKRNGQYVIAELKRYLRGESLYYGIDREQAARLA
jgi:phosphoglycerate dehydrogenase-like enzyme